MKIPLTQGKFAIVGHLDYAFLNQWKWCYHRTRNDRGYATRTAHIDGKQVTIRMHRVVLQRKGFKDFAQSDHANRNTLDNRRGNLRAATTVQSSCNQGKQRSNTSGYVGVHWHRDCRKWCAQIKVDGLAKHLGLFNRATQAARAYDSAAKRYHGRFAVLNKG